MKNHRKNGEKIHFSFSNFFQFPVETSPVVVNSANINKDCRRCRRSRTHETQFPAQFVAFYLFLISLPPREMFSLHVTQRCSSVSMKAIVKIPRSSRAACVSCYQMLYRWMSFSNFFRFWNVNLCNVPESNDIVFTCWFSIRIHELAQRSFPPISHRSSKWIFYCKI